MAGVKFEASALKLRLQTMIDRSKDSSAFFRIKAEELRTLQDDAFVNETSPSGEKWAPKSEVTHYLSGILRGARKGASARAVSNSRELRRIANVRTQTLSPRDARKMQSLTKKSRGSKLLVDTGTGRRGTVAAPTKSGLRLGNNTTYMGYHVTGTKKMPKRNFLGLEVDGATKRVIIPATGPAGEYWDKLRQELARFLVAKDGANG